MFYKRMTASVLMIFTGWFLLGSVPVFAKLSRLQREKKQVAAWCKEKWFIKNGKKALYGEQLEIAGLKKLKLGNPQKNRWACLWKVNPAPGEELSYEHYWVSRYGKEPYRDTEHRYLLPEGTLTDTTYIDTWLQTDAVTRQKERCKFFSGTGNTKCLPLVKAVKTP